MTRRALVTNDDGIQSPGLHALARAAVGAGYDVTVAAPREEASGSSASLTAAQLEGRVVVEPYALDGLESITCNAVAAAPGFIALIALRGAFGPAPDVVFSGINRGANTGNAIIHSGTVGATVTAAAHGAAAIAVSTASAAPSHWDTAAHIALYVAHLTMARGVVMNLNVPDLQLERVRGIVRAGLASFGAVQTTLTEVGKGYVKIGVTEHDAQLDAGSDAALVAAGFATVTPLSSVCENREITLPDLRVDDVAAQLRAGAGSA